MSIQDDGYAPLLDNSLEEGGAAVRPTRSGSIQVPDPPEEGLTTQEARNLIHIYGYNELASKEPTPILDFLKNFWGPMPIMIWIACAVELIPKPEADHMKKPSWADFGVLMTLQIVNGLVGWYEHKKAGDAVDALKAGLSPLANVKRNNEWITIAGRELVPGDKVKFFQSFIFGWLTIKKKYL